jgi:hypothetical protein
MFGNRKPKAWVDPAVADRAAANAGLNITVVALFLLAVPLGVGYLVSLAQHFSHTRGNGPTLVIFVLPSILLGGLLYNLKPPLKHWLYGGGFAILIVLAFALMYFMFR